MDLLLLNGPPRSGKDVIGDFISEHISYTYCLKLAQPIRDHMCNILGCEDSDLEAFKGRPLTELNGMYLRDAMISYSEDHMKPLYGKRVFGDILVRHIKNYWPDMSTNMFIVTDSGFNDETRVMLDANIFDKVHLVKLYREDTSYDGDSRNYLTLTEDDGIFQILKIDNDGTISEASNIIMKELGYA